MATRDTGQPAGGITRRDFVKATAAATAVAGCGLEFAFDPAKAAAYETSADYKVTYTTCPYCSASCGQRVVVDVKVGSATQGQVVDIYGDFESPWNQGGLCAKGAGAIQLVNNERRIGVGTAHTESSGVFNYDSSGAYASGIAYKRVGTDPTWTKVTLDSALADIAVKLTAARGTVGPVLKALPVFTAGDTVDGQVYTGFSGYSAVRDGAGWRVGINGNKVDGTTLAGILTNPVALLAAFDELIFTTDDLADKSRYVFVGRSDLGTKLMGKGALGNTADVIKDGASYRAFVCDGTRMVTMTSTDMVTWDDTTFADYGKPAGVTEINSPSVIKSASTLHVWFNAPNDSTSKIYYASYNLTTSTWSAATAITVDGVAPISFAGHPQVSLSGTTYTIHYVQGSGGIFKATGTAPAVFTGKTAVYDAATLSEGNVYAGHRWLAFTQYDPAVTNGWAFADVKAVVTNNNSKSIAFFGSSHMNNEPNYVYRKLIANFGSSNVEHQARI